MIALPIIAVSTRIDYVWGKYLKLKHDEYEQLGMVDEELPADEQDKWSGLDVDRTTS